MSLIILVSLLVLAEARNLYQQRKYMKMIDSLTEKVMSRNYQDYTSGQVLKTETVVREPLSDEMEARIEDERRLDNVRLEKNLNHLDKGIETTMHSQTG